MSDSPHSSLVRTTARIRIRPSNNDATSNNNKKCHTNDISSPLLKEPFKKGWKREVVYRSIVDDQWRNKCDIYYFAPDGKKFRSMREISSYLNKSNSCFSIKNFSFFKEPIGMDDDNQEICRFAGTKSIWHAKQSQNRLEGKDIVCVQQNIPKHSPREEEDIGTRTTNTLTKKRKRSCDDEEGPSSPVCVENQNKRRVLTSEKPQGKKQQYPILASKATSMTQPPTLPATSSDSMPLLTRFDDKSSPACSVHDSSDEDQEKVESLQLQENKKKLGKKKQDSIPALRATMVEAPPTLHVTDCDNMPLLKRIDEESSPAFSVHDTSDEDQEKVESPRREKQQDPTFHATNCDKIPLLKRFDELSPVCSVYDSSEEDQESVESHSGRPIRTQGKKQQDPIPVVKATSMKQQPPTLCATSCDNVPLLRRFGDESSQSSVHDTSGEDQEQVKSLHGHHTKSPGKKRHDRASKAASLKMPLLTRFDEESSPACSVQDCEDKTESSDEDQEKVESPAPVISGLREAAMPFPETLPLNSPLIALLPLGTTLVLTDPSTLRIIPSRTVSTSTKETEIPHPKSILSQPSTSDKNSVADSSKTSFRKPNATKKIQWATLPSSPSVNKRKLRSNKKPATAAVSVPKSSPSMDGFAIPQSPSVYLNQRSLREFEGVGNQKPSYWESIGEALIEEGLKKAFRSNPSAKIGDNSISVTPISQMVTGAKQAATPQVLTCKDFFALRKQKRKEQLNHEPQINDLNITSISAVNKSNQYSTG